MQISSDLSSLVTLNLMSRTRNAQLNTLRQLSTGNRINSGADDPAGLIASQKLAQEMASNNAAVTSAQRASSKAATADAAAGQITGMLSRIQSLQVANAGNTISASQKAANQMQISSLLSNIDRVASGSIYAGHQLLTGTATLSAGGSSTDIPSFSTMSLGTTTDSGGTTYTLADLYTAGRLSSGSDPELAGQVISQAIKDASQARGGIGAFQTNQIETTINSLTAASINMSSSYSSIADTDYASGYVTLMQQSLQLQAQTKVLSMQNKQQQSLLDILA